jgi:hypothetical protein
MAALVTRKLQALRVAAQSSRQTIRDRAEKREAMMMPMMYF